MTLPLALKELLKQMFHKPRREMWEKRATNGRWFATPGKLISEKSVANCNPLGLLLVSAVVAFFLVPRSFVLLFVKF